MELNGRIDGSHTLVPGPSFTMKTFSHSISSFLGLFLHFTTRSGWKVPAGSIGTRAVWNASALSFGLKVESRKEHTLAHLQ